MSHALSCIIMLKRSGSELPGDECKRKASKFNQKCFITEKLKSLPSVGDPDHMTSHCASDKAADRTGVGCMTLDGDSARGRGCDGVTKATVTFRYQMQV
jgi:hypothetical protein